VNRVHGTSTSAEQRTATPPQAGRPHWSVSDGVYLMMALLMPMAVTARMSRGRIFWEDELLGWLMLRDPSWRHMLMGWLKGVDGGGILFYFTGRVWFSIFNHSVLSFRLYTATGFGIAFVFIWAAGRRFYRSNIMIFAVLLVWFGSPIPIQTMSQGRFYGLLMAMDAIAVYLFFRLVDIAGVPGRYYAYTFFAHTCLIMSHILGVFYSSLIVLAMVVLDFPKKRWRPWLYLTAALPDLLLIPCLPAIRASAAVGKPHFWSSQPTVLSFIEDYSGFSLKWCALLLLAAGCVAIALKTQPMRHAVAAAVTRRPVYVYTAVIFLLPLLFLLEGFFGPALCIPRYLLPVSVGTIFVVAEIVTLIRAALPPQLRDHLAGRLCLMLFLICVLAYDLLYMPRFNDGLQKDFTQTLTAALPKGIPIVCEDGFAFTELISLQHSSGVDYTFLLDWPNATAPTAPRVEVTQYHLMQNWQQQGYFSGSIRDRETFLRDTSLFYTISFVDANQTIPFTKAAPVERYPQIGNPLHRELAHESDYRVELSKVVEMRELSAEVWRLCRLGSGQCR
jgi:hypothetical protein